MRKILLFMIFTIGFVGVYDTVLTLLLSDYIIEFEQNLICKKIMETGGIPLFVQVKAASTLFVVLFLFYLIKTKYKNIVMPIFVFQCLLFYHLSFSANKSDRVFENNGTLPMPIAIFVQYYGLDTGCLDAFMKERFSYE